TMEGVSSRQHGAKTFAGEAAASVGGRKSRQGGVAAGLATLALRLRLLHTLRGTHRLPRAPPPDPESNPPSEAPAAAGPSYPPHAGNNPSPDLTLERHERPIMTQVLRNLLIDVYRDEEGATLVEYILLAVLIGVAAITGMTFLGKTTSNKMNNIGLAVGT